MTDGTDTNLPLLTAQVEVDRRADLDRSPGRCYGFKRVRTEYADWIRDPILGDRDHALVTFEGVTYASLVERDPLPVVRIALVDNSQPHPLIGGATLRECRPLAPDWERDRPNGVGPPRLYGFRVTYTVAGGDPDRREAMAEASLESDVGPRTRYELRDTAISKGEVTMDVFVPSSDTANLSVAQRLFPTADRIESLGGDE